MPECISVGEANPDIAGLGIVIALAVQGGISVILSLWLLFNDPQMIRGILIKLAGKFLSPRKNDRRHATIKAAKDLIRGICDSQIFAGMSLLIAAVATRNSLTIYHYHIIYDLTNFTAVSFCAALVHVSDNPRGRTTIEHKIRIVLSAVFSILHLAFSILYGQRLEKWDWTVPGRCYNTRLLAMPDASHPYVDRIYLGITCFYMQSSLILCFFAAFEKWLNFEPGEDNDNAPDNSDSDAAEHIGNLYSVLVILAAMYQYPLHLYSTIALRLSNESLLEGDSENSWGFGQVSALVLVVNTLIQCGAAYHKVSRSRKRGGQVEGSTEVEEAGESTLSPLVVLTQTGRRRHALEQENETL
ncbi:hypothetical protein B0T18DRAFT_234491 [Schizothecium vesticola]|uniref:Uncharacterized protein n=1 Tax=Schizothecium vesticola TaxID=314040 RepID=A0AA40BP10_9PEZI|nr:hypothetical protein B0T18DRAFT_234491 [Schizothecium vesticola]